MGVAAVAVSTAVHVRDRVLNPAFRSNALSGPKILFVSALPVAGKHNGADPLTSMQHRVAQRARF